MQSEASGNDTKPSTVSVYDVVVFGDPSGAVVAAIAAKHHGHSVILLNPTGFPGGMSASGLGATDFRGRHGTFGGTASEFFALVANAYRKNFERRFEPHVGQKVFEKMITDADLQVVFSEMLDRTYGKGVTMNGKRIESITTLGGKRYRDKMFIDATYVGDLLAAAGVHDGVGVVLNYLEQNGLLDKKIVIYSTDNEWHLGDLGLYDKRFMYEPRPARSYSRELSCY